MTLFLTIVLTAFSMNNFSGAQHQGNGWREIKEKVEQMNDSTTYEDIVSILGKPYKEFASQSLPEEYVLYFEVPNEDNSMYWIILNTESQRFLYWSEGKQAKSE